MRKPISLISALNRFCYSLDFTKLELLTPIEGDVFINKYGNITDEHDNDIQYIVRDYKDPDKVEIYYRVNEDDNSVAKSVNCIRNPNTKIILKHMNDMTQQITL